MARPDRIAREEELYLWLTGPSSPDEISVDLLRQTVHPSLLDGGLLFLDYLVRLGLAVGTPTGYRITHRIKARAMLMLADEDIEAAGPGVSPHVAAPSRYPQAGDLVVNIPLSLRTHFSSVRTQHPKIFVWPLPDALAALIGQAEKEILMVLPFLESDGLGFLADAVARAGSRGVVMRVLGRGLLKPEPFVHAFRHAERVRAFRRLLDMYTAAGGDADGLLVRDFGTYLGGNEAMLVHHEGIHQKMLVVDRRVSYTGSGEVRMASFLANGEAGQIHGPVASAFWADLFELFWDKACPYHPDR